MSVIHDNNFISQSTKELTDLLEIAVTLCQLPIASFSLLIDQNQNINIHKGLNSTGPQPLDSFIHYIKENPDKILKVRDTITDERFSKNPLVCGKEQIKFYAGLPLISSDNQIIGTISVMDTKPNDITPEQENGLALIAKKTVEYIENRRSLRMIKEQFRKKDQILARISEQSIGVLYKLEMDQEGCFGFSFLNNKINELHPSLTNEMVHQHPELLLNCVHPQDVKQFRQTITQSMKQSVQFQFEFRVVADNGKISNYLANAIPEKSEDGKVVWYGAFQNITISKDYENLLQKFLYDISHGLRRPISTLMAISNAMDANETTLNTKLELMQHIKTVTGEMDSITKNLNNDYYLIKQAFID